MKIEAGQVAWQSPANIALVKYWGKKGPQLPANPSVSMTLKRSVTVMEIAYSELEEGRGPVLDFTFEGRENREFEEKILRFLQGQADRLPFLEKLLLKISSRNTFPHSAGIASSASSMSALALCLVDMEQRLTGRRKAGQTFRHEASDLSRLASGSACRSVYGGYAIWGKMDNIPGTDDRFAIPMPGDPHSLFRKMQDAILVVSAAKKSVSSRAGHSLMTHHPLADARYAMAYANARRITDALLSGDMDTFIRVTEQEALTLHGMMMSSEEPFILLHANTLRIIERIRDFRKASGIPACFTIDAGPNIHLLYPEEFKKQVSAWINEELTAFLEDGKWIDDQIGPGPENLNEHLL